LIKGDEVGEVGKLTEADRTLDRCIRSVVVKWLGLGLLTGRWK
jgi:hypothetical protein